MTYTNLNGLQLDHPLVRATQDCPVCGADETSAGALMCWPCWRRGGKEGAFDSLLDAAESWHANREARARAAAIRQARDRAKEHRCDRN